MRSMLLTTMALLLAVSAASAEEEKKKPPFADGTATPSPGAAGDKKGPPFADGSKKEAPKPEQRTWNVTQQTEKQKFAFAVEMKPGIPDPDQLTEVVISANAIPPRPDPVFGSQVPLEGSRIVVEVQNPAGQLVGRYITHPMPFAKGRFGFHLTPSQEGIYTLAIRGRTAKGDAFSADVKLPVKVWPLPTELQGNGEKTEGGGRRGPIVGN